jgi:hypothetical protein
MGNELDEAVNDIISQLKGTADVSRQRQEEVDLTKDQLEEFIIKSSGKLVTRSLNLVDEVREYVASAPESRDVSSLAELINATVGAVESLNKIHISDERNKTQVKVKQMDIDSKERINITDNKTKILLSREDIMKALVDRDDGIVDVYSNKAGGLVGAVVIRVYV